MSSVDSLEVVYLEASHYDEIVDLWRRAGLHIRPSGRDSREAFRHQLASGIQTPIGLRDGDRLVAVALATHDSRKGWINRLAVDPEYRRRGLGLRLIRLCEEHFRRQDIHIWTALIEGWNTPSLALFRKAGYVLHDDVVYASRRADEKV
ncbi:MAG: GNAT family N-acetyltransferase [Caldilineales bacterium]|nr:GNAT family N-acetyltransferase [Caldilineales bacterium]MDW8319378.1 GNAT family N-acetyltransferase [Anaerolineae bacterium]